MTLPPAVQAFARRCFDEPDRPTLPPRPEADAPPHAVALALAVEASRRCTPALQEGWAAALADAWLRMEPEEAAVSMTATYLLAMKTVEPSQRAERADQLEIELASALSVPPDPADASPGRQLAGVLFRVFGPHTDASPSVRAHRTQVKDWTENLEWDPGTTWESGRVQRTSPGRLRSGP